MTRHWIEVYPDRDYLSARVVCEHPEDCQETNEKWRVDGCSIVEWVEATSVSDLLDWPANDHPVIGRLEIAVEWSGCGEDADLRLTRPTGGAT